MRSTWRALGWHAVVTAVLVVFLVLVVVLTPSGTGVNFLIVIPALPIIVLGLPWSVLIVFLAATYQLEYGRVIAVFAFIAPALLNVVLHAAVVGRGRRTGAGSS